ncbi:hypothetical protein [Streptomyces decoyicus]|uniref:hypothetical protein n=1 Tax=Streptomyces decoyicus TaxID=249567 RepID=UPI0036539107
MRRVEREEDVYPGQFAHQQFGVLPFRTRLFRVAILSDYAVYLSHGPSPLDFMPHTDDGKPLPGGFRLGVSPGMVKHEGTSDFLWLARNIEDEQINPARHIKGDDAPDSGE